MIGLNSQAVKKANQKFYDNHPELNDRLLDLSENDSELRKEWNSIYAECLKKQSGKKKPLTIDSRQKWGDGYRITKDEVEGNSRKVTIVIPAKKPEFVEGIWLGKGHKKILRANFGDSVKLLIKSRFISDDCTAKVAIYDFESQNEVYAAESLCITNNEISYDLFLSEDWYPDIKKYQEKRIYIVVSSIVDGVEIKKKLPNREFDYLRIELTNNYKEEIIEFKFNRVAYVMVEGIGIHGSYSVNGFAKIFKSNDNWYLNVVVNSSTATSQLASVEFFGSVELLANNNSIKKELLSQPKGANISKPNTDTKEINQPFLLPSNGNIDIEVLVFPQVSTPEGISLPIASYSPEKIKIYKSNK